MAGTGAAHLIFISIVGVDRIPYGYYRDKVASEKAIEASGVPFTIIRVTQFHGFVHEVLEAQRRLPVTLVLPVSAQTIHMPEVAERLATSSKRGRPDASPISEGLSSSRCASTRSSGRRAAV